MIDRKQIIILNGGLGTRVKSISGNNPKCLIKFFGHTFLERQLKFIEKKGFNNVILCLGHKSEKILNTIKNIKFRKLKIHTSIEKKQLGTGGAILNAFNYLDDYFFVMYGDSYLRVNFKDIEKKFLKSKKNCLMTVIHKKFAKAHNPNILIENNFLKKYKKNEKKFNYIDYGLLIFKKNVFKNYKKKNKNIDLSEIIENLIMNKDIAFHKTNLTFFEIGSIKGISDFKSYLVKK